MPGPDPARFLDPATHGHVRVATAVPAVRVADPAFNARATVAMLERAAGEAVSLVVCPELGLTAYTCDDLFHQRALLDAAEAALLEVAAATARLPLVAVVGLPLRVDQRLFNVAAVLCAGRVLGVQPKSYLPNYGEFYEARQFVPAAAAVSREVRIGSDLVPFGPDLVFRAEGCPGFALHAEVCEDVWTPIPPSTFAAMAGATVLVNLSASNITIGKAAYREQLARSQSARCIAAYLYTSAGFGESTTDLAWDGQSLVCENGELLAESPRFETEPHLTVADVDLERLAHDRLRMTSWADSVRRHHAEVACFRSVAFDWQPPRAAPGLLRRRVTRHPYVPANPRDRDERCAEVYQIQVAGLAQRLKATGIGKLVIGISGGLDSTHALLVAVRACDRLGLPRTNVLGITMPGFATSTRTLDQARRLMTAVGCSAEEIDIRPSCRQMLADIGHPFARGEPAYDVTFENVQAGERTSHLFRLANRHGGLVVGTGDLSELALGWSTYGVGDHMSHYNVNASVPKTLVRHLVHWQAMRDDTDAATRQVLLDIAGTEVSPELVPGRDASAPEQSSEASVGPYDLQDFHLHQVLRHGHAPSKVAFLAWTAWHDATRGEWPAGVAPHAYTLGEIKAHLRNFLDRFFRTSQFKRSTVPNAPKVGSGGSLSPRGDWRAPSDGSSAPWLAELDANVPDTLPDLPPDAAPNLSPGPAATAQPDT